ncbi:sodium transporter family protein [Thermosinus carboxydivorans Nor1]|uniref:Sodium transporter family protein n=1 Tax=Thermosinus carboxydivorans Nor1 TaxID=401526 RepID=A1HTE9_9FIRM|nr:sodium-dependent transporter [Thermosinus carboxydivorans]EAX46698.1 sodium transporter family protein [Thermosinus carboxydivorans Nor1]
MLAGIAIFPTVFSFGMEPGAGPGLLFMTIPLVFSKMPFGNVLLVAFFFLTSIAATTAMLSLVEVLVAYLAEEHGLSRRMSVLVNAVIIVAFGALAALSVDKASLLGHITIFGKGFFDLFDYISSNILLPVGGLLVALFVGYAADREDVRRELTNRGALRVAGLVDLFFFVIRYVTPAALIVVFLNSVGVIG